MDAQGKIQDGRRPTEPPNHHTYTSCRRGAECVYVGSCSSVYTRTPHVLSARYRVRSNWHIKCFVIILCEVFGREHRWTSWTSNTGCSPLLPSTPGIPFRTTGWRPQHTRYWLPRPQWSGHSQQPNRGCLILPFDG